MVAPHLYFNRISERRESNQFNGSTHEQTHFHQPGAVRSRDLNLSHLGGGARDQRSKWQADGHLSSLLRMARCGRGVRGNGFNQDFLGELSADTQTNIANLANNVGPLRQKANFLLLAKSHLAEPVLDLRRRRKLLDPHGSACTDGAQWADKRLRTIRIRFYPDISVGHCRKKVG